MGEDGQGMPGHAVVPIASSLSGSQFCERSPPTAHTPRAVPQSCPLLPDHFPQAQLAQLVGRDCLTIARGMLSAQRGGCRMGLKKHVAVAWHVRFEKWSPGRSWNQTPLIRAAGGNVESSPDPGPWIYSSSYKCA